MNAHSHEESRAAFERLFRDTRGDLLAFIARRSRSDDAADILAETYLIAWQKLDAIPKGDRARLWLFGVARNLLLKSADRRHFGDALVGRLADEIRRAQAVHAPAQDERSAVLFAALAALPERDREILTLTAWEGLTPKQIAVVTGSSANIVRVRLSRARARLKRQLGSVRTAKRGPEPLAIEHDY